MRVFCVAALAVCANLQAQIPQGDLETKSKRESFQDGLEIREVRESSAKDPGEALSKIDGIWKLRKGAIANDVVLRGFQGNNLNLLIDGVRIYGACPGHMDPAAFHVDFAEVERVDVTKGGFDITNQGSLGGAINIIRKRAPAGFHITPSLQWGSFGYWNPSIAGSAGSDRFEISGGYSYRQSEPFLDGQGNRMTAVGGYRPAFVQDDAFRIQTGWTALRFSPVRNQSGELSYTRQDGANTLYPYLQMDSPYDIADRLGTRYEIRELGATVSRIQLQAYYTRVIHWMTDEKRLTSMNARDVFSMATFARTRTSGGRADVDLARGFVAGFETYQRNWNAVNSMRSMMMVSDQNIVPNVNTTVAGSYLNWSRSLTDRLRVGAGARLDTAHMYVRNLGVDVSLFQAYQANTELRRRDTNPSANGFAAFALTSSLEIFAGAGSTVRVPDAQERYFNQRRTGSDWVGNPGLAVTRNTEANAGINIRRRGFYLKPLFFYSYLSDFVTVHDQERMAAVPGVMNTLARSYENVSASMYGGEVTYSLSMGSRWLLAGGASYTHGLKTARPLAFIYDTDLAEIPPFRSRASLRYGRRAWFAEVEGVGATPQRRVDGDLRETPTAGYAVANLKGGVHIRGAAITAGIDNLFDRFYYEHLSFQRDPFRNGQRVPEPGRSLFINIGYTF